ncbi:MAG TPA: hypothetical protein VHT53_03705 [Candidatus Elarobacter sp.]|jgi:hypothetical protein|nr:hypothetical protein [Candidatus Elarobacter sp.]
MAVTIDELHVEVTETVNPQGPAAAAGDSATVDLRGALDLLRERAIRLAD